MKKYFLFIICLCTNFISLFADNSADNDTIINNICYHLQETGKYNCQAPYYVVTRLEDCEQTSYSIVDSIKLSGTKIPVKGIERATKNYGIEYNFTHIGIPKGIEYIESNSFSRCNKLESLQLPSSLRIIKENAFTYCYNLKNVYLNNKNTCIEIRAFCDGTNLPSAFSFSSITTNPTQTTIYYFVPRERNTVLRIGCYILPNQIGQEASFLHDSFGKTKTGLRPNEHYREDYGYILSGGRLYSGYFNIGSTKGFRPTITEVESYPDLYKFKVSYTKEDGIATPLITWGYCYSSWGTKYEKKLGEKIIDNDNDNAEVIFKKTNIKLGQREWFEYFFVRCKTLGSGEENVKQFTKFPDVKIETIKEARTMSNTVAIVCANINVQDTTTTAGFEWRRYDAPELVPSSRANCPVVDGVMMGALKNLSSNTYYKFRPYYKDTEGTEYFGEWSAFGTADAYVYFEPTVRTYSINNIEDTRAEVRGFAIAGSDPIVEQGFEYWESDNTNSTPMYNLFSANNKQIVNSEGQWMSATLENLNSNATYTVRAFVKTEKGTTYGEQQTFTTTNLSGNKSILRPTEEISMKFIGQERNCIKLYIEGLNNEGKYQIYSINGTLVCSGTLDCTETAHIINIPNLTSGMYLLKVISNKQCKTLRFVTK